MSDATQVHIHDRIAGFIRTRFPAAGEDLGTETPLLEGIIDSLGIFALMTFLSETYGFEIQDEDFVPEHFETLADVAALVARRRGA